MKTINLICNVCRKTEVTEPSVPGRGGTLGQREQEGLHRKPRRIPCSSSPLQRPGPARSLTVSVKAVYENKAGG